MSENTWSKIVNESASIPVTELIKDENQIIIDEDSKDEDPLGEVISLYTIQCKVETFATNLLVDLRCFVETGYFPLLEHINCESIINAIFPSNKTII